jgi:hypothetical protein
MSTPLHSGGSGGGGAPPAAPRGLASSPGCTGGGGGSGGTGSPRPWGGPSTPLLDPRSLVIGLPLGEGAFSHVYEGLWLTPSAVAADRAGGAAACGRALAAGGLSLALRCGGGAPADTARAGVPPLGPVAVAVKVLKADRQGRCGDCYRLIREAQVLARLAHK